ncbi:hypothetical protein BGY98DRAFT_480014 [Russula aff. rugulosa BPL654]|nr:hypothetical protein BGY98DRAFT_480014 [Russula aff. rugulosa BPL654]
MASMSSESPMRVDEPDHHANTFRVSLTLLHQRRPGLAFRMKVSQFHEALLEGPEVIERLADRDGFKASVEPDGEKRS